jgi:hypothetical protein
VPIGIESCPSVGFCRKEQAQDRARRDKRNRRLQHARRREFQNLLDGKEGHVRRRIVSSVGNSMEGELVNMDRCLTHGTGSPNRRPKQERVGHVGHWRAFLTTTPRTRADAWRGAAGPSHFPLTTVSRVSPSLSAPAFSVHLCRALPAAACTYVSRTTRSLHLWAE